MHSSLEEETSPDRTRDLRANTTKVDLSSLDRLHTRTEAPSSTTDLTIPKEANTVVPLTKWLDSMHRVDSLNNREPLSSNNPRSNRLVLPFNSSVRPMLVLHSLPTRPTLKRV